MHIVFLTVHDATSQRKVDFHFWSDVMSQNDSVDFVTVGFSYLTNLKPGGRRYEGPFNCWLPVRNTPQPVRKFIWRSLFHPMRSGSGLIDKVLNPIFTKYPYLLPKMLLEGIAEMDLCIVENGAGLLLVPELQKRFPRAKFIYNVCDRIETLGYHPAILAAEAKALPKFDKIRVPAEVMENDFPAYKAKTAYIPHGLKKTSFNETLPNPYSSSKNVVSVGDMLFDEATVTTFARRFPEWKFHLFGRNAKVSATYPNIITYGERPFEEIAPYIKHADIGLAPYKTATNADYLSQSSMKMIQYTYCHLPILAPHFAATGRTHVCGYDVNDEKSIVLAMENAIHFDRTSIDTSKVLTWEETVKKLYAGLLN